MIKIAIVEDDRSSRKKIKQYIDDYSKESGVEFKVTCFTDGINITENYRSDYDIIFMDVLMPKLDGMKTAEFIRELDKEVIIIFITNMAQYAIKGYAVDALDYLIKPVSYFAFSRQLKRSVERIENRQQFSLLIPTENGLKRINSSDMYYIESFKHQMTVHSSEGTYSFYATMKDLEEKLAPAGFARCNNCYLVNLAHVKEIRDNIVVVGDGELSISRPRKKAFMDELVSYVGKVGR